MNDDTKKLIKQNEIMIALLRRIAFSEDEIRSIVTSKKQNPQGYIDGYNACNGRRTLSKISNIVGVKPGTLSPILKEWEDKGIIYEVERPGGKFYKKVRPI